MNCETIYDMEWQNRQLNLPYQTGNRKKRKRN